MKTVHQSKTVITALMQALKKITIMKAIITTAALMLLSAFIYSQSKVGKLKISVIDGKTKATIAQSTAILVQKNKQIATAQADVDGNITFKNVASGQYDLKVLSLGYATKTIKGITLLANKTKNLLVELSSGTELKDIEIISYVEPLIDPDTKSGATVTREEYQNMAPKSMYNVSPSTLSMKKEKSRGGRVSGEIVYIDDERMIEQKMMPSDKSDESYTKIKENTFITTKQEALSTFSIDVDKASYSNVRRFINAGQLPPKEAVRTEELINYFPYQYRENNTQHPVSIQTELTEAPWQSQHYIAKIAMNSKKLDLSSAPDNNLVFLLDVSGSMSDANKLPLVKSSLNMLLEQMRPSDRIAIVVYAGAAGLVLPSTTVKDKQKIKEALENLSAGGSTAGGAGIELAYKTAKENFVKEGNNRIILCTDGDFNVGISSEQSLESLIEEKRKDGVYLTVLGFGMGNYKDSKMEILADKGNGNYAYIDNIQEAKKTLVNEMLGTLYTVAKDVKIQIEFNPALVQAYRLIGYENRMLAKEDFNNDLKDAGEVGAGHQVTAIYEIIPVGVQSNYVGSVDKLKYTNEDKKMETNAYSTNMNELLNVKCRYKLPESSTSIKFETPILIKEKLALKNTSEDTKFTTALAAWSMLLRNSDYKGNLDYKTVIELAKSSHSFDPEGYRAECIRLMESSQYLKGNVSPVAYGQE
jgi:Ca-activated chloride channel homolog